MDAHLDVFAVREIEVEIEPDWLGCTESLAEALQLIQRTGPGSYFVSYQKAEHKSFYKVSLDGSISLDARK
jgi:hypothetical protein